MSSSSWSRPPAVAIRTQIAALPPSLVRVPPLAHTAPVRATTTASLTPQPRAEVMADVVAAFAGHHHDQPGLGQLGLAWSRIASTPPFLAAAS